jgi:queuine tRNA-ribosyltransferase
MSYLPASNSSSSNFTFDINACQGRARAGTFHTPHGDLLTPFFAPVGTKATLKATTPAQLEELNASLVLANTYHLYLRPGDELVNEMGGLHRFMSWPRPILTDSGGFQVFSLSATRKIDEDGVTFKSHIDGSMHRLTPEKSIAIQEALGADIIMAFDECAPPYDLEYNQRAMARTHAWAQRCLEAKTRSDQALFGIVQGGIYPDLRQASSQFIASLGFPGHAIGGLSVGETKDETHAILELVDLALPQDKPRYLMGVGRPEDILEAVERGCDLFDCVLPTRNARKGTVFTSRGKLVVKNASFAEDERPLDPECDCLACRSFSRAYLRHLFSVGEILALRLATLHSLRYYQTLMQGIRSSLERGDFASFKKAILEKLQAGGSEPV